MDIIDCLKVKVIEAEGLISPNGLLPSPYVEIVLGQQKQRQYSKTGKSIVFDQ